MQKSNQAITNHAAYNRAVNGQSLTNDARVISEFLKRGIPVLTGEER